jgi:bifunctional UDP-N-acetylglucosamine pyrophosphorylase/glucosamine-1-phosphate N-acetyltransferase/UDP-N-acetylglucosamine pyrophosphorylase
MVCREEIANHDGPVLVVTGDSPLVQTSSINTLLADFRADRAACILGTATKDDPGSLGRVVRDANGDFTAVVEFKDATPEQRAICEVNMSTYVFDCQKLLRALDRLRNDNAQNEYYITDCPGILRDDGELVRALDCLEPCESMSINNVADLAEVEAYMRDHPP